jgi:hypothetical protein
VAETKMMRPPVEGLEPVLGFTAADLRRCERVVLRVLKEPRTSISITDLKALGESVLSGARKFPAAPALEKYQLLDEGNRAGAEIW